ncbi:MAG: adenine deaminase [Gammaproteobacteria bacterium]|nr:adenine deaminase [Gammaproteobacteria bacterium]
MRKIKDIISVARGQKPADLVIKNGQFLDVFNREFISGDITIYQGIIAGINGDYDAHETIDAKGAYIVPGFIDSHVHIESSMLTPNRYEHIVLPKGTTSVIWDPHEISNVKGTDGIKWALESSEDLLLDVFIMLPSCVPSTDPEKQLETSGAHITAEDLEQFLNHPRVLGLAEMMNFPGVLYHNEDVIRKIKQFSHKTIDGHCPLLTGRDLNAYIAAGIHTDHEATEIAEAKEKISKGLSILIREGSCAKDAKKLLPLLNTKTAAKIAFCSDDRNPLDLQHEGHIDHIINMALKMHLNPEDVFYAASYSPARLYNLNKLGAIAPGFQADLCLVTPDADNWNNGMRITSVIKKGIDVTQYDTTSKTTSKHFTEKNINLSKSSIAPTDIQLQHPGPKLIKHVIELIPNQIVTNHLKINSTHPHAEPENDILKIVVLERHKATGNYSVGFVKGFNLKGGAIASSINHDTHNIIAVGIDDTTICEAINELIKIDGGIVVIDGNHKAHSISLPVGGLMTDSDPESIVQQIQHLQQVTKALGCTLSEPFLQLAFLALPVIPHLKITDQGLVDVTSFTKISPITKQ